MGAGSSSQKAGTDGTFPNLEILRGGRVAHPLRGLQRKSRPTETRFGTHGVPHTTRLPLCGRASRLEATRQQSGVSPVWAPYFRPRYFPRSDSHAMMKPPRPINEAATTTP